MTTWKKTVTSWSGEQKEESISENKALNLILWYYLLQWLGFDITVERRYFYRYIAGYDVVKGFGKNMIIVQFRPQ